VELNRRSRVETGEQRHSRDVVSLKADALMIVDAGTTLPDVLEQRITTLRKPFALARLLTPSPVRVSVRERTLAKR
jgi:hypothetical protein